MMTAEQRLRQDRAGMLGLAVDLSVGGIASVVTIRADGSFDPAEIQSFSDVSTSTLTAIFLEVERTRGSLRPSNVVLAIPGVPGRSVVPVLRSRWTLSREGLDQFFGRPVTIINDGAALAWAAVGDARAGLPIGDTPPVRALRPLGRRVLIQFEAGLGAALVDSDADGRLRVLETEMGHLGFSAADEVDDGIVQELRAMRKRASWEQMLQVGRRVQPSATFGALTATRQRELFVRWAADFVQSVVLASCAWDGIYLSGSAWAILKDPAWGEMFTRRLRQSHIFARQFVTLPCWHVDQAHAVLRGCGQVLLRSEPRAAGSPASVARNDGIGTPA